ncbi:PREDICTED: serine hydrolase-like protein isoform X2 [Rhagoletis zephyria]|uniref:serine hydrolase-like protein isoform X2 n=1 Tax=Rhagoletis zephyria TaxID=28612 RepID=UPI000811675A|nr:PREDICTED: serine hydrolase-like protein isoform X2 [Rhagoletis zephyria]
MVDEPPPREFEDIRIKVPWGHIAGRWYGDRNLRPILAIHGWLDNLGTWDTLIPLLPQHIGILCIDLPGHGYSSKYPPGLPYHAMDYVNVIIRVMKEYEWEKVSLLAHSLGSIISFTYAALFPRTVDMIIAVDVIKAYYPPVEHAINNLRANAEKMLLEEERIEKLTMYEPPSYTYEQLKQVLYEGSQRSVEIDNCKYLLSRNITKSRKFPDKYYFSRDGRVKIYTPFIGWPALYLEMAKRIKNVPYLVIKGTKSDYINEDSNEVIDVLRQNNPHFEFHEIDGTHHVHLNNPSECAAVITPFINAHRPAMPNSWAVDDDETVLRGNQSRNRNKNAAKRRLRWLRSKL